VRDPRIQYVMFTGSVANGHAVIKSASDSFKGVGIELGGKDPAYVRPDADLEVTIPGLVDGAFFNAGQSCCSVEVSET
jgi:acyl-CoA reductase-like NAD-dependent aldehyde dehydrogenase